MRFHAFLAVLTLLAGCSTPEGKGSEPENLLVDPPAADGHETLLDEPSAPEGTGEAPSLSGTGAAGNGGSTPLKKPSKAKIPPPMDRDTEGAVLPLPEGVSYLAVRGFMEEYRDAYLKFMPLATDYRVYFSAVGSGSDAEAREAVELRVRESFERAHWVYLYGIQELMEYMSSVSKGTLMIDREENFVARMRTISHLGGALTEISGEAKYKELAREVYISMSKKHFGRNVRARGRK